MAIRQPSPSSPRRFSTGTSTPSQNTSAVSGLPLASTIGRASTPVASIGARRQVMPWWGGTSWLVRTRSMHQSL